MLSREERTRGPETPPMVKVLFWFTDGSRTADGTAGVCGQSVNRRLSIPLGKLVTVVQGEVYAILACVHEIDTQDRPENYSYISICCESGGSESASGCLNNVSFDATVPAGVKLYLYPACHEAILGIWPCRTERKLNR